MRRKNSKVTRIIFHRAGAAIGALWADCRGVSAILTGLAAMVLIGFAGLAIDVAAWQATQRHMQGAADQAAIGAVIAYLSGGTTPDTQAKAITANYGFTHGVNGVAVSVASVPSPTGYDAAYTVSISQAQPQYFSSLFLSGITVGVNAEAATASNGPCILGLGTTGQDVFLASGGSTQVDLSNCDLDVNSSDSKGTEATGGSRVFAQNINIKGGSNPAAVSKTDWASCTSGICYSSQFKTGVTTPDPYQYRTAPTVGTCPPNNTGSTHDPTNSSFVSYLGTYSAPATTTLYPGLYCGGITIGTAGVTMKPGTYVLTNNGGTKGSFTVSSSGASVSGTGVTIYLTGNSGAEVKIQGGSTATLTAPTSGETAGIVFWNAGTTSSAKNQVTGGSAQSITGAMYAPSEEVDYTGGSSTGTGCTQIVAKIVQLSGGSYFHHDCAGTGVSDPASSSRVALIQ